MSDDSVIMLKALLAGESYPPDGITPSPEAKAQWDQIASELASMPAGVVPDIPWDYNE